MPMMWNREVQYRGGDAVWVKCGGCGQHFELRPGGDWVGVVLNEHEDDRETIDFCSQACLDAAAVRGSLAGVSGRFGAMTISEEERDALDRR